MWVALIYLVNRHSDLEAAPLLFVREVFNVSAEAPTDLLAYVKANSLTRLVESKMIILVRLPE